MASQVHLDLQSLRGEITVVATTLTNFQDRLAEIMRRSEEERTALRARINELESHNHEILNAAKWLRVQNSELERKADLRKPEVENAIDARNAAIRKWRRAKMVIRDLLDERRMCLIPGLTDEVVVEGRHDEGVPVKIDKALCSGLDVAPEPPDNSDSEDTVRTGSRCEQHPEENPQSVMPQAILKDSGPISSSQSNTLEVDGDGTGEDHSRSFTRSDPVSESSSLAAHPSPTNQSSRDLEVWKIHYSKPPASAPLSFGPLSSVDLLKKLGRRLDEDAMFSLDSVALSSDLCPRLQITNGLAFVYDPIIIESQSASYLLDWGRKAVNQSIETYITHGQAGNLVFHTFLFPVKPNAWFYVGAHTWTVTDLWVVWPTLNSKSRQAITAKLKERSGRQHESRDIAKLLDSGELTQFCVQISSLGQREKSRNFAIEMGYLQGQAKERKA